MPVSEDFREYVLEQLRGLGRVSARRMFGAIGLYCDALFFGIVDDDTLYLKVDERNREEYVARGMKRFCPDVTRPGLQMGYYEVPADVLEDTDDLAVWARRSVAAAASAAARKARSPSNKSGVKKSRRAPRGAASRARGNRR